MILFESIEVKNVMNYGNAPTKLSLNTHRNTIITGKNGAGKSSILLDSLCYVLYGKPYRDIKLGQLINSINNKAMLVTIIFTKGTERYCIKRGQKPSVFVIEHNDIPIDEKAIPGSLQEYLEEILGMNFPTFKQVVVVGSANYIPFMRLPTSQRREVVESMLPLKLFTEAARLTRERIAGVKRELSELEINISNVKKSLLSSKELLLTIESEKKKLGNDIALKRESLESEVSSISLEMESVKISSSDMKRCQLKLREITDAITKSLDKVSVISHEIKTSNDMLVPLGSKECPMCHQTIDGNGEHIKEEIESKVSVLSTKQRQFLDMIESLKSKKNNLEEEFQNYHDNLQKYETLQWKHNSLSKSLSELTVTVDTESEVKVKENIASLMSEMDSFLTEKTKLISRSSVLATIQEMCKDSGVKAMIVQEFIPFMNQLINEYLNAFDLFVNFELDSEFNESIKSRNRDNFSYNSFSEGEKQRIDLAILFSWRDLALKKNAAVTNLLIFDETLDKSLDPDAVDVFMTILEKIGNHINVFVVSHKDVIPEVFDRSILVEKINDFAVLTES
jgi:DNA repair exonuclease SbcCD ATPase subunit